MNPKTPPLVSSAKADSSPTDEVTTSPGEVNESVVVGKISTRRVTFDEFQAVQVQTNGQLPAIAAAPKDLAVGERLVEMGLITPLQLDDALAEADTQHRSLTELLLQNPDIEEQVLTVYSSLLRQPALTRAKALHMKIPQEALAKVPSTLAWELNVAPLSLKNGAQLLVAALSLSTAQTNQLLMKKAKLEAVVTILTGPRALRTALNRFYDGIDEDDPSTWLERG